MYIDRVVGLFLLYVRENGRQRLLWQDFDKKKLIRRWRRLIKRPDFVRRGWA